MSKDGLKFSKHDKYVEDLCTKIRDSYDSVSRHVTVKARKRMLAEVDVLARRGTDVDMYEVKCSPRVIKARLQLRKLNRYLGNAMNSSNCYLYCGSFREIVSINVK